MKLVLLFDCDADLIDVPVFVIENKDLLQKRFTKWIYNKNIKHKYWVTVRDSKGKAFLGVRYRSDAFVEWLNKKVLLNDAPKAIILEEHISEYPENLPVLLF